MKQLKQIVAVSTLTVILCSCIATQPNSAEEQFKLDNSKRWLAGDHHIHGKYSAKWNWQTDPPTPILFGDAHYFTALNAQMARYHGLEWMVTTDHGGPNHSKVNQDMAYPELLASRKAVPEVLQYYGMEFDMPSARHGTLIIAQSEQEDQQLYDLESQFNRREIYPDESIRDTNAFMHSGLEAMQAMSPKPILVVNHPSRQAQALGEFTKVTPQKMTAWQNTAPNVVIGMTGIPGHQAAAINPDGSIDPLGVRAEYNGYPTHGGTDQMSAILGGVWDSFLGEGRRWSITAVSDSHAHYTEGRTDFWPGEYAKTYVYAEKNYTDVMQGLRSGNVFITTGNLINELYLTTSQGQNKSSIGDDFVFDSTTEIQVTIAFKSPEDNSEIDGKSVARIDLIYGEINIDQKFVEQGINPTTQVIKRFYPKHWQQKGDYQVMNFTLPKSTKAGYLRIRGTNKADELEPEQDPIGEDPWQDLWFYSNPIYLKAQL